MAFRGFTRQLQRHGAWFQRVALGTADDPVFPPLHIKPSAAPTATAEEGDIYLDTNGVLQVHNGTNFIPLAGDVVLNFAIDTADSHISKNLFVADRAYQLISIKSAHVVASTSGTLAPRKCTGTQNPAIAGTQMTTSSISTSGAPNTVVSHALSATAANTVLAAGDRIGLAAGGTATNYVGGALTFVLRPI